VLDHRHQVIRQRAEVVAVPALVRTVAQFLRAHSTAAWNDLRGARLHEPYDEESRASLRA
jgi:hypothetical protein